MNTFLQIVIVCSNQCVAEVPRVFTERIVIDTEPKGFHILNHKHGGGSCVALAERVNLPNIRCKFCKVFHRRFNRQSLIGKLFFGGKIIIQSIFYTVKICIDNCFAAQYPFFFGNVIFTKTEMLFRPIVWLFLQKRCRLPLFRFPFRYG